MARIRTVKPEFWTDEKIGRLKREVRLLFIGLWNISDDQGVIKSNAAYIKGQLFSYDDDLRGDTVNVWLASLVKARMLVPFTFEGEGYYVIRTFSEHQLINRPSKPKFSEKLLLDIRNNHGVLTEYSQPEGNVKEKEGSVSRTPEISESNLFRKPNIPTKTEVLEAFVSNAGTKEMAKKFYETYEATDWFYKGSPVKNFKSLVYSFIENWNKNLKNGRQQEERLTTAPPLKRANVD